ncbi:hypothetical protein TcWFU_007197 [Taenia crassiceps]|uniref:Uncharacterized protein n=1 Tax=Taenia crassiceps TaxID=6207 RepID=A0ABR4QE85_9CEST
MHNCAGIWTVPTPSEVTGGNPPTIAPSLSAEFGHRTCANLMRTVKSLAGLIHPRGGNHKMPPEVCNTVAPHDSKATLCFLTSLYTNFILPVRIKATDLCHTAQHIGSSSSKRTL